MVILKIEGIHNSDGVITLKEDKILDLKKLQTGYPVILPEKIKVEISLSIDENDFINGKNEFVWATFDLRQAEVIQSTLLAQQINSEIKKTTFSKKHLFLIKLIHRNDTNDAIDFIWKGSSGLRLKPDWDYAESENNKSFQRWLGEQ
jgi:hypothetical protein